MPRKKTTAHIARKVKKAPYRTDLFKPGDARRVDNYFVAQIVTGIAIGLGAAIGTIVIKWIMEKWDKYTGILPDSYRKELYGGSKPAGDVATK